jgi:hypothetical protein
MNTQLNTELLEKIDKVITFSETFALSKKGFYAAYFGKVADLLKEIKEAQKDRELNDKVAE